jgi:threonine/homoserine/homoserine lactone efflux protein
MRRDGVEQVFGQTAAALFRPDEEFGYLGEAGRILGFDRGGFVNYIAADDAHRNTMPFGDEQDSMRVRDTDEQPIEIDLGHGGVGRRSRVVQRVLMRLQVGEGLHHPLVICRPVGSDREIHALCPLAIDPGSGILDAVPGPGQGAFMTTLLPIIAIAGALAVGAMSPGPSFLVVVRTAVAKSRRDGLATALGMGVGGTAFAGLALLGLTAILASVEWLYLGLKVLGGLYLIYLATRIWRGAKEPIQGLGSSGQSEAGGPHGPRRSFLLGLTTQLSNPKTAIYYASVFAALLPAGAGLETAVILLPAVFLIEAGWYTIVALAFSSERPRQVYLRWKSKIDRVAGAVLALLGIRLIAGAVRM